MVGNNLTQINFKNLAGYQPLFGIAALLIFFGSVACAPPLPPEMDQGNYASEPADEDTSGGEIIDPGTPDDEEEAEEGNMGANPGEFVTEPMISAFKVDKEGAIPTYKVGEALRFQVVRDLTNLYNSENYKGNFMILVLAGDEISVLSSFSGANRWEFEEGQEDMLIPPDGARYQFNVAPPAGESTLRLLYSNSGLVYGSEMLNRLPVSQDGLNQLTKRIMEASSAPQGSRPNPNVKFDIKDQKFMISN